MIKWLAFVSARRSAEGRDANTRKLPGGAGRRSEPDRRDVGPREWPLGAARPERHVRAGERARPLRGVPAAGARARDRHRALHDRARCA